MQLKKSNLVAFALACVFAGSMFWGCSSDRSSEVGEAIKAGNIQKVKELAGKYGFNSTWKNADGKTLLELANGTKNNELIEIVNYKLNEKVIHELAGSWRMNNVREPNKSIYYILDITCDDKLCAAYWSLRLVSSDRSDVKVINELYGYKTKLSFGEKIVGYKKVFYYDSRLEIKKENNKWYSYLTEGTPNPSKDELIRISK